MTLFLDSHGDAVADRNLNKMAHCGQRRTAYFRGVVETLEGNEREEGAEEVNVVDLEFVGRHERKFERVVIG